MTLFTFSNKKLVLFLGIFSFNTVFASDLIFTAPPRESAAAGTKLYQPIATYLSKVLDRKVRYEHPGNWFAYQVNMRKDKFDIVFDGPHFISWRIKHLGHQVLVKLPGSLKFMLVTDANNKKLNKSKDLIGKNFCGISLPNLSSLSFLASFSNPVSQPEVKGVHGGMDKVFQAFENKECHAAILRDTFYKKDLSQGKRNKLKTIFTSTAFPNQAISVSKRLSYNEKNKIIDTLTTGKGISVTGEVVKRFGNKKAVSFKKTKNLEYDGYNRYLEGVIFGW